MDDIIVNTHEAKSTLSQLLKMVEKGHNVIISRAGKPVGKLSRYTQNTTKKRQMGQWSGKVSYDADWDETPNDIIDSALNGNLDDY